MRRILSVGLVLIFLLAFAAGCSGDDAVQTTPPETSSQGTVAASQSPEASSAAPVAEREVDIAVVRFLQHVDWDQMYIWQKHLEDTGIKINWTYIPAEGRDEQKNLMIATREYPDAFWGCHWTNLEALQYIEDGIFVPIDEYLPEYGPNITKIYQEDPAAKAAMTLPDGHIYSYGQISTNYQVGDGWAFRSGWMEKLGLEYPTTTGEFMDVMMAMKNGDPNGNGEPDEYPYSAVIPDYSGLVNMLLGSWGLANRGAGTNSFFDADPTDDTKLRCYATDDRFREVLRYVRDMEANGLIDPESSYQDAVAWGVKTALPDEESLVGVAPSYILGAYSAIQHFQGPNVLIGPYGDQLYPNVYTRISTVRKFNFVVTDQCDDIPAAIQVVDYWMDGGDNTKMFFYGEEGTHYTQDADGIITRTEAITNDPQGRSVDQMLSTFTCQPGGFYPALFLKWPMAPDNMTADMNGWLTKIPPVVWEAFTMAEEEIELTGSLNADISQYYNESVTQFINGTRDIDSDADWDAYKATFEQVGLGQIRQVYQDAYDRYLAQ